MRSFQRWWFKLTDRGFFALGFTVGASTMLIFIIAIHAASPPVGPLIDLDSREQNYNTEYKQNSEKDILYWPRRVFSFEDSIAQWLMMGFTVLAFWVLLLTLKVTREVGKAQTRAYLTHSKGGLWSGRGVEWALNIRNTGNSVARDVYIIFEMEYWVEYQGETEQVFLVAEDGTKRPVGGKPKTTRHIYSQPIAIGDLGAGEVMELSNSSFVGVNSEHSDGTMDITAANVGLFAVDVFGEPISYFGGVGWFESQSKYDEMKNIRAKSAPHRTSRCVRRMTDHWEKKKGSQQYWDE